MPPLPSGVSTGARVFVRGQRWRVEAVLQHPDCRELHLAGGAPTDRRVVLWPFDRPVPADATGPPRFTSVHLRRWAAAVGAATAGSLDPLTPRGRATATILPYQLAPAIAMAAGVPRLILADEVGLGKTIQAGWIAGDLLAREPAARILIAVPAGLRRQWQAELSAWFAISVASVDARWLRGMVADIPADVSPWAAPGAYLGSIDFLKRADVAASLVAHVWDLLVVDEAHTAGSPTDRHAALAAVAKRARRVVAITATPYSGDTASFASMAALGATPGELPPLMFRRSRADTGDPRRRRHRFAAVRITRAEARLQRLLERYSREVWRGAPGNAEGARLAVTILRKRALSSPAAAARSLRRRLDLLCARAEHAAPRQLTLFDDEDESGDELPDAALAAPGLADATLEQRWLATLIHAADAASAVDSKERALRRLLARVAGEPVIVFTEYRDTLLQLAAALPPSMLLHGGMTAAERAAVQARFNEDGGLLLATDAAAEGLNLQRRCRIVVNYELPWNPARLEQRIGRVDRIGQPRAVHAITLVARDTAEDLVIANLARRLARVVATLGQRDRLGAFLNDARIARLVIEGTDDQPTDPPDAPALVRRDTRTYDDHVGVVAERLARRRAIGAPRAAGSEASGVLVSTLRASSRLASGTVVAIRFTARTDNGDEIATRLTVIHLPRPTPRPATRAEARAVATATLATLPDAGTLADADAWFKAAAQVHQEAIAALVIRETALLGSQPDHVQVQPGLFDRRALRAAAEVFEIEDARRGEHRARIDALERARRLHLSCEPVAVLIVWR